MNGHLRLKVFTILLALFISPEGLRAQSQQKSLELSDTDGLPVLLKHLPDWENVRHDALFAKNASELKNVLPDRPVVDLIDFSGGTEAVTAAYPAGRLLIVEYTNPQASIDADARFTQYFANNNLTDTLYRRIGNYSVFVFDARDAAAAGALIDQIKYEKTVQWLGEDPTLLKKMERAFVATTTDIFVSTVELILLGIALSLVFGIVAGYFFFQLREKERSMRNEFSDAGGMVRLNLDGLTPEMVPERLLKD
jgi:hypothetical protein